MTITPVAKLAAAAGPEAEAFYIDVIRQLGRSGIPYLLGGTFAVAAYTGLCRPVKDLDVFCKAGDYPRILGHFRGLGYEIEIEDERWIAKVRRGDLFVDVIFNSAAAVVPVTEEWLRSSETTRLADVDVPILSPTELVWSKAFVQDRCRYDGADIAHVILKRCEAIDWSRLLSYMEPYWEVLLIHVLNFRFVYPTERHRIPRWLLEELMGRLHDNAELPVPQMKVCRGRLFSREDYRVDVADWGFADIIGEGGNAHD